MTYNEARDYIENLRGRGIAPGLENIGRLCEKIGNPEKKLKFVHIAGTNGKGSTGAFLESILIEAGLKTARFVSPAVGDYLEMYTINGSPVPESDYAACVKTVREAVLSLDREGIYPTSFEAETAIAFLLFTKADADIALIECGMGGLLDSTNIIPPPSVAVITSISTDHTSFLGGTVSDIAAQKCGIIKSGSRVVTCPQAEDVMQVINKACDDYNVPLTVAGEPSSIEYDAYSTGFTYKGCNYETKLLGTYQPQNAALAIEAALLLGVSAGSIVRGINKAEWVFRFTRIGKYILDGAHNPGAAEQLAKSVKIYSAGKTAFIAGVFKDKDYDSIARITAGYADAVCTVSPPTDRGLDSAVLARTFKKYNANTFDGVSLKNAVSLTKDFDTVVIFGSLSILKEAKQIIEKEGITPDAAL